VAGELLVRWWDRDARGTGSLYDYVVPTETRFKMRPDAVVDVPERYGTIRYRFNARGYRDRDHVASSGRRPILLLGDSVTFGLGVDQSSIYAEVLQRQLDVGLGPRYDVFNLALFSYHSGHELAAFREDGAPVRPALVVTQFYMNDFEQLAVSRRSTPPAPSFGARLVGLKNVYLNRSALYRRARQGLLRASYLLLHDVRRRRFPDTLNDAEPRSRLAYLNDRPDDATIPAFTSLLAIRDEAAAVGARFVLVTTPNETELFTNRFDGIEARLRQFCARNDILLMEALPLFRREPRPESLYLDGLHLTAEGHRLLGNHLATRIAPLLGGREPRSVW
jgi:lysophospholipase L1-like esterase